VLAIGVPRPSGRDGGDEDLKYVEPEIARVRTHVPSVRIMENEEATHGAVLLELPKHSWIHIACHGHQDGKEPLKSRFRLQDRPLTIQDIMNARLPNAEFAFLSACHSATGDANTPDESLHLAGALQFVGFRSVVGTLWAMGDEIGPDSAEAFYAYMFRDSKGEGADLKDAAVGLSKVIQVLRTKKVPVDRWTNFIHVGA